MKENVCPVLNNVLFISMSENVLYQRGKKV